jgi:general secretion pathway protein G
MTSRQPTISDAEGFSLVELVIVVVIIGIIAAIAIPRVSGASQSAREAALRADLKLLRDAIELYSVEHKGDWPAMQSAGNGAGAQSSDAFARQLTWYTTESGDAVVGRDSTHILGPYLRKVPPLPVGVNAGSTRVFSMNAFTSAGAAGAGYGWEYEHYFGRIRANCVASEVGSDGTAYFEW